MSPKKEREDPREEKKGCRGREKENLRSTFRGVRSPTISLMSSKGDDSAGHAPAKKSQVEHRFSWVDVKKGSIKKKNKKMRRVLMWLPFNAKALDRLITRK